MSNVGEGGGVDDAWVDITVTQEGETMVITMSASEVHRFVRFVFAGF